MFPLQRHISQTAKRARALCERVTSALCHRGRALVNSRHVTDASQIQGREKCLRCTSVFIITRAFLRRSQVFALQAVSVNGALKVFLFVGKKNLVWRRQFCLLASVRALHRTCSRSSHSLRWRADVPQQQVCEEEEEEVLPEQQLWNQERSSSVDQEEPEAPQIKEEQEELCSSQEGEQLGLKEETDTFMVTAAEEGEHSEPGGDEEQLLCHSSAGAESQDQRGNKDGASELPHHQNVKEVLQEQQFCNPERNPSLGQEEPQGQLLLEDGTNTFMLTATCEESDHSDSETDSEQLLSDDSPETESRDQETSKQEGLGLTEDAGSKPNKGRQGKETYQLSLPISVSQCNETFSISRGKKHHMIQNNVKLYVCKICRKIFVRRYHLSMHMRIHTGEKPYCCETCGKRFSIKRSLARHITAHTGEKPYCCETCGKSFSAKNSLSYHITTHSGEKPYSCEICRKCFGQSSALYLHKKTHTGEKPYHCDICGKSFRQAGHLSRHKKTHTGEKPYSCETCGKSFSQSSVLCAHKKIHTGEKPYHCEICGKNFSQKSHLSRHTKTHTAEKL
ncbi:uncharacterized protein LOC101465537 isoform X1 [Maylandia zebra]|uniref:uncharacterized protein LOC101465537 isoform X1 n=1 Tax=Maylandia zebra TaxID=106582 RepID=UPI00403CCE55